MEEGKNKQALIIGIDDAGRGCVIGKMCLAGVLIRKEKEEELRKEGVNDSKLLTPKKRESLVAGIKEKALAWKTQLITPIEIDTGMGEGLNLNQVEALAAGLIINELVLQVTDEQRKNLKIILDCPSINTSGWKNQLMGYVRDKKLVSCIFCEHKADFNHIIVSAASIIAKTTRDSELEKIKKEIGVNFGSGYPSDPQTQEFLEKNAINPKYKGLFRESWSTWQTARNNILGNKNKPSKQSKLF